MSNKMMFSAIVRHAGKFAAEKFDDNGYTVSTIPMNIKVKDADIYPHAWQFRLVPECIKEINVRWEHGLSASIIVAKWTGRTHNIYEVLQCTLKNEQRKKSIFLMSDMSEYDETNWEDMSMPKFENYFENVDDGMFGFMD